jgi:hypothetical protein
MLIDAIGQFAGTFVNPAAAIAVLTLALFTRRAMVLRLATVPVGMLAAAVHLWPVPDVADVALALTASSLAVLLQVELLLQVAFPTLAFARRLLHWIVGASSVGNTPPPT